MTRVYLDVPYSDKDEAKRLGARWDGAQKRWYAGTARAVEDCARWAAKPDLPSLLPGEDRSFGSGLFVDLVPSSCWFTNVRSCVSQADWERLRRMIIKRAGDRCEVCGIREDRDDERWMEAHERWDYNDEARVQTLKRIICLCTDCHRTTHYGFAMVNGDADWVFDFLMQIRESDATETNRHIEEAFALWEKRSEKVWELDLSILTDCGIEVTPPPSAELRVEASWNGLPR